MKKIDDYMKPCIMMSQTWPDSREKEGDTLDALKKVIENGFFTSIQTVEVPYKDERKKMAQIVKENNISYTYCLARIINENNLNLADLDDENRLRSVDMIIEGLKDAKEAGAKSAAVISGPTPSDSTMRGKALDNLADSMIRICRKAKDIYDINIILEPLDYFAHKKFALGTAEEAVQICKKAEEQGQSLYLNLDTAHMLLNDEDPAEDLKKSIPYVREFHFCNAVKDKGHDLFGDRHLAFGEPGILDLYEIAVIMKESVKMGFYNTDKKPVVACEVRKIEEMDSEELLVYCENILKKSWEKANREL